MSLSATSDPPFSNIARQAHKLMEQMQKGYFNFCPSETWTPSVNLYETAAEYVVCVDLAGVEKEKIDLEIRDNRLKLSGHRVVPRPEDYLEKHQPEAEGESPRLRVHLMEIDHGGFCREVELPLNIDAEQINASYRNGMLWIEIPKV